MKSSVIPQNKIEIDQIKNLITCRKQMGLTCFHPIFMMKNHFLNSVNKGRIRILFIINIIYTMMEFLNTNFNTNQIYSMKNIDGNMRFYRMMNDKFNWTSYWNKIDEYSKRHIIELKNLNSITQIHHKTQIIRIEI